MTGDVRMGYIGEELDWDPPRGNRVIFLRSLELLLMFSVGVVSSVLKVKTRSVTRREEVERNRT